jgi:hypothetical protein
MVLSYPEGGRSRLDPRERGTVAKVYIKYSPTTWQDKPYIFFLFSSRDEYLDIHYPGKDFEAVKIFIATVKQMIPTSKRNYDPATKIWMIEKKDFDTLQTMFGGTNTLYDFKTVTDVTDWHAHSKDIYAKLKRLQAAQAAAWNKFTDKQIPIPEPEKPEDFFHSFKEQPLNTSTSKLTIDQLIDRLYNVAGIDSFQKEFTKSDYRRAALKLHPDRNNGDGSRMAELNMLWEEYKKLCPATQ